MSESSLYTRVFEELTEGVAIVDPETERFEDVNRAYADVFGYEPAELEGASFVEVISDGVPRTGTPCR
ncbi:PAS domain-containing protein [Saliphagus sp. GCM10025308]